MSVTKALTVLGATGSIGCSTLDVIARHPELYKVFALTAHTDVEKLFQQCQIFKPQYAVISTDKFDELFERCKEAGLATTVLSGESALCEVAAAEEVDYVMAAIVGAAGLLPTLSAVKSGKRVLLANKEALVMSGQIFMSAVEEHGAELLPIDSEHNAIFQCLSQKLQSNTHLESEPSIHKILLTASGGPFRSFTSQELCQVTPEQACQHPNWSMGRKITVDSATLMNKGLELIEACWLFGVKPADIQVLVHPQSIVHSMVQYSDGSVLAQLGNPDMRTPIAYALGWPERIESGVKPLNFLEHSSLSFESPDELRFPCLRLAKEAFLQGGAATAVLNASNEIAVDAFLREQIGFTDIPTLIEAVMLRSPAINPTCIDDILSADRQARQLAQQIVKNELTVAASERLTSIDGV